MPGFYPIYNFREPEDPEDITIDDVFDYEINGFCHLCHVLNNREKLKVPSIVPDLREHFYGYEKSECYTWKVLEVTESRKCGKCMLNDMTKTRQEGQKPNPKGNNWGFTNLRFYSCCVLCGWNDSSLQCGTQKDCLHLGIENINLKFCCNFMHLMTNVFFYKLRFYYYKCSYSSIYIYHSSLFFYIKLGCFVQYPLFIYLCNFLYARRDLQFIRLFFIFFYWIMKWFHFLFKPLCKIMWIISCTKPILKRIFIKVTRFSRLWS